MFSVVGGFPGFYSVWLPEWCWDTTGQTLFCSESWGSLLVSGPTVCWIVCPIWQCYFQKVVQVNVESGDVRSVGGEEGAWSVMCVSHDIIVAQHASPCQTPRLVYTVCVFTMLC